MNKKGFTLVELLAVIVILAILMVSAGAAVMSTLNNARVNTFKNEALAAINVADNMYTEISMDTSQSMKYLIKSTDKKYRGMCVTLHGLVHNGYLNKDLQNDEIKGVVLIEVPYDGGSTKKSIWMTNGTYAITGYEMDKISGLKFKGANNDAIVGTEKYYDVPKKDASAPASYGVVTDDSRASEIIDAANGTEIIVKKKGGSSIATVKTMAGANLTNDDKGKWENVKISEFHSPSDGGLGGTGAVYNDIPCINAQID